MLREDTPHPTSNRHGTSPTLVAKAPSVPPEDKARNPRTDVNPDLRVNWSLRNAPLS